MGSRVWLVKKERVGLQEKYLDIFTFKHRFCLTLCSLPVMSLDRGDILTLRGFCLWLFQTHSSLLLLLSIIRMSLWCLKWFLHLLSSEQTSSVGQWKMTKNYPWFKQSPKTVCKAPLLCSFHLSFLSNMPLTKFLHRCKDPLEPIWRAIEGNSAARTLQRKKLGWEIQTY